MHIIKKVVVVMERILKTINNVYQQYKLRFTSSCQVLHGLPFSAPIISAKGTAVDHILSGCTSLSLFQNLLYHYVVGHQVVEPCTWNIYTHTIHGYFSIPLSIHYNIMMCINVYRSALY